MNEATKFLEELLFFCVPWEVRSVSHQVGCVDRSVERCAGALTRRCGNDGTWTSWIGVRCCTHPCRKRTARSVASIRPERLAHQQCPIRVDQLQGAMDQTAGLRPPEAVSDSEKLSTSTWVNWTSTRDGHPHQMLRPRGYCDGNPYLTSLSDTCESPANSTRPNVSKHCSPSQPCEGSDFTCNKLPRAHLQPYDDSACGA